jgi:hypothetical protein
MCDTCGQNADSLRNDPNERIVRTARSTRNGPIGLRPRDDPFYLVPELRQLVLRLATKREPNTEDPRADQLLLGRDKLETNRSRRGGFLVRIFRSFGAESDSKSVWRSYFECEWLTLSSHSGI